MCVVETGQMLSEEQAGRWMVCTGVLCGKE